MADPGSRTAAPAARWLVSGRASKSAWVYRWRGRAKSSIGVRRLDDLPGVHDRDAVGAPGDDAEVVGHQHDRHLEVAAQPVDAARGSAPGSSRRAPWSARRRSAAAGRRRARSRSSPAGACRRRTGAGSRPACCRAWAMPTRSRTSRARLRASLRRHVPVQQHGLGDLVAHGHGRVERGERVLEDHADAAAADRLHLLRRRRLSRSTPSSRTLPSTTWPPVGSSRRTESAVIVLPHPDSPTRPRHSPAAESGRRRRRRARSTASARCRCAAR